MVVTTRTTQPRGIALIGALLFTFLVLTLATAVVSLAVSEHAQSRRQASSVALRNIAEAGVDRALYMLSEDPSWRCASGTDPAWRNAPITGVVNGQTRTLGTFTVDRIVSAGPDLLRITCHAFYPNAVSPEATKTVVATVYPKVGSYFAAGAFGKESVQLGGGIDSYDSRKGLYASQAPSRYGTLQTNGVTSSCVSFGEVDGHVVFGNGTNLAAISINTARILDYDSNEANDYSASPVPVNLPDVVIPSGLTSLGDIDDNTPIPPGTWRCDSISFKGNKSLQTGNGVTLYCNGPIEFKGKGSMYPASGRPADLVILGTNLCTSVDLCGNGNTTAAIYTPNAECRMNGGGNSGVLFGAIVANTIRFNGNHTWVHYDLSLGLLENGAPYAYRVKTWEER